MAFEANVASSCGGDLEARRGQRGCAASKAVVPSEGGRRAAERQHSHPRCEHRTPNKANLTLKMKMLEKKTRRAKGICEARARTSSYRRRRRLRAARRRRRSPACRPPSPARSAAATIGTRACTHRR
eukprot:2062337-Pleurochrysis_carterae.AAC.1